MVKAQAEDARGDELDLDLLVEPPSRESAEALDSLRRAAGELDSQESDPGAMDDLRNDIDKLHVGPF
jgi:hypothetical protein